MTNEHKDVERRYYRAKGRQTWHILGEDGAPLCAAKAQPGATTKADLTLSDRAWICRRCNHRLSPPPPSARPPISFAPPMTVFQTRPYKASSDRATVGQQNYLVRCGCATAMEAAGLTVSEASAMIDSMGAP